MKIGNTVVIRKDLKIGEQYGMCTFSKDMEEYLGRKGIIRKIDRFGFFYLTIDETEIKKKFTEEMLETEMTEETITTNQNVDIESQSNDFEVPVDVVQAVAVAIEDEALEQGKTTDEIIGDIKDEMNGNDIPEIPEIPDENPSDEQLKDSEGNTDATLENESNESATNEEETKKDTKTTKAKNSKVTK